MEKHPTTVSQGTQCGHISTTVNILYTVKLRIESTRLTVNQVAMCYLALPFTSQYFIETPIAVILKNMHVMCMYWGSGKDTSELENLKLLLLFTRVLNGHQFNYKMHAAVKTMYGRHTACSVFYLERREQTTSTSTYIQYKITCCICEVVWTVTGTKVTNTIVWSNCCVFTV